MVRSWLLNAISKEIVGAFIFATTVYELWSELEEHFSESNDPLIYQLQRQITSISQGDSSLSKYYTKRKQLWDQLNCLIQLPPCTCGSTKAIFDHILSTRLVQFLMGLNDTYASLRNQILALDPLPSVYKAYSMALSVEKQREVQINFANPTKVSAMLAKASNNKNVTGHNKDICFKIHGYPDWFKELKEKKKMNSNSAHMANMNYEDNPIHAFGEANQFGSNNSNNEESMNNIVQ
ncbi:hypothetical protein LXL04_007886 [Taraxacum kok-saghyz]